MTPTLDRFLHQWALYKRALLVFFVINVFSVIVALVLGFNYFTFKRNLGEKQSASLNRIERADAALIQLSELQKEVDSRKTLSVRNREDERRVFEVLGRWQELKAQVSELKDIQLGEQFTFFVASDENKTMFRRLSEQLNGVKADELKNMKLQLGSYNDTTRLLIWTGLLTLLFGLVLPMSVMALMSRAINNIRHEMQNTALEFIKQWSQTYAGFGDGAFKNVEFWLQILLLAGSYGSRMSSHPVAQVASELAHIIRMELQKRSSSKQAS